MWRPESILVALDGSPSSLNALRESIRLARWGRGRVTAVTVAPPYEGDLSLVGLTHIKAAIGGRATEILSTAMEIAEAQDFHVELICEEGEAHQKIIEWAARQETHLIVLGASTCRSIVRKLIGSVGSRVREYSPRDVLAIPENVLLSWEKILLVADCSEFGDSATELALALSASCSGELKVVLQPKKLLPFFNRRMRGKSEAVPADGISEALKARAERMGIKCDVPAVWGDLSRMDADLTIIGLQVRRRFFGILRGNPVDDFIGASHCPVLVVKSRHGAPAAANYMQPGSTGKAASAVPT